MCGIAGHVSFSEQPPVDQVVGLVRRNHHRGPDDSGLWVSANKEYDLVHARLSVIDLSSLGHQADG